MFYALGKHYFNLKATEQSRIGWVFCFFLLLENIKSLFKSVPPPPHLLLGWGENRLSVDTKTLTKVVNKQTLLSSPPLSAVPVCLLTVPTQPCGSKAFLLSCHLATHIVGGVKVWILATLFSYSALSAHSTCILKTHYLLVILVNLRWAEGVSLPTLSGSAMCNKQYKVLSVQNFPPTGTTEYVSWHLPDHFLG